MRVVVPLVVVSFVVAALPAAPARAGGGPAPASAGLLAQADPPPAGPGRLGRRGKLSHEERQRLREQVRRKMQTFVTVELASRVGLDEKKALLLSEAVKGHLERKERARRALRDAHDALQKLVDEGADDAALAAQMKVVSARAAEVEGHDQLVADAAKFLSTKEQAKLVLALPQVLREVGRMLRDARHHRRGADGPPLEDEGP